MDTCDRRKLLSVVSHGAIIFSLIIISILIPIAILRLSNDSVVKENAKESINFHINLYVYASVVMLIFTVIGDPLVIVLAIVSVLFTLITASLLLPLMAIARIATEPQMPYRYPSILRLF